MTSNFLLSEPLQTSHPDPMARPQFVFRLQRESYTRGVLVSISTAVLKHYDQRQLGEERVYSVYAYH